VDGLRGAAVLAVLATHFGAFLIPAGSFWPLPGGFLGVDVFLVLSGFLITALLLTELGRTGGIRFPRFLGRRATRLLPALIVLLAAHWAYSFAIDSSPDSERRATLFALTFTSNWEPTAGYALGADIPLDLGHLWTLALEGQFYLLWPVVLWLLTRGMAGPRRVALAIAGLVVTVAIVRVVEYETWGATLVYTRSDSRLDALLVGALLAVLWSRGLIPEGRGRLWAAAAGLVVLAVALTQGEPTTPLLYWGGYTVVALAAATIILAALDESGGMSRALAWRPLRGVGLASYSVYLWHLPVFIWAVRVVPDPGVGRIALALSVTAVLSAASYFLVERPVMQRRGRV
jgi:peptidoglycan/LPS O-acetylase OafA/YrhL